MAIKFQWNTMRWKKILIKPERSLICLSSRAVYWKSILENIHGLRNVSEPRRRHTLEWNIKQILRTEISTGLKRSAARISTGYCITNSAMNGGQIKLPIATGVTCGYRREFAHMATGWQ